MCITTATLSADERDDRWRDYTLRMLDTLSRAGVRHYIKKDLQRFPSAWLSISAGSFSGTSPPCSNSFPTNRRSTRALIAHLKLEIEKLRRALYGSHSERKAPLLERMELDGVLVRDPIRPS